MRAKKHPHLAEVTSALSGKLPETTLTVDGHTYVLKLGKPEAEDWAAIHTEGSTVAAALLNARKPTLATSLVSVDGLPVEQLFQIGDDIDPQAREELLRDGKLIRDWRREQILDWLKEDVDTYVTDSLYSAWRKMYDQHKEALREVENLSMRTLSPA